MEALPDFGLKIKLARIENHMKQIDLAKAIGKSAPLVSQWESGKRTPDVVDIWKICWALNVAVSEIIPSPYP